MNSEAASQAQQLAREKALYLYSTALERGDLDKVAEVLQQAEQDPVLEHMIMELNEVYQAELEHVDAVVSEADDAVRFAEKMGVPEAAPIDVAMMRDMRHVGDRMGHDGARLEPKRVLCVDDEPEMLDLLNLILARQGFEVYGARNKREALDTITSVKPDVVLLDLMMPEMGGWEVYQQMQADETMRDIPVIVVTAKAMSIDKTLGLHIAKVNGYITKPFEPGDLLESISNVLQIDLDPPQEPGPDIAPRSGSDIQIPEAALRQWQFDFLMSLRHDLRGPVSFIMGYLELALEVLASEPAPKLQELRAPLERAHAAASRLQNLGVSLDKMLDAQAALLQGDEGREARLGFVALDEVAREAQAELQTIVDEKGIEVAVTAPDSLPLIRANGRMVRAIVSNLLENALRWTPSGGQVLVEMAVVDDGQQVSFINTGQGIAEGQRESVFQRFYQARTEGDWSGGLRPLDLLIVKELVEWHGGRLWAENRPEGGTAIHFSLPANPQRPDPGPAA